jgi:hypothetical protein
MQTKASALYIGRIGTPKKTLHQMLLIFFRDAYSVVFYRQNDVFILIYGFNLD